MLSDIEYDTLKNIFDYSSISRLFYFFLDMQVEKYLLFWGRPFEYFKGRDTFICLSQL